MPDRLITLADGRRLQVRVSGVAEGPTVMFLPGCPDSRLAAASGDAAAERAGIRLVAVNRPGYGRSDPARPGQLLVADDVARVADVLGADEYAMLGMSLGGPYAVACAARYPARVSVVGLVASPAEVPSLDPPVHRDDLSPEASALFSRLATMAPDAAMRLMRADFERYVAGVAIDDPADGAVAERASTGLAAPDAAFLREQPAGVVAASTREALADPCGYLRDAAVSFRRWEFRPESVGCPVWLWYGEHDENVAPRNGSWLVAHLPDARMTIRAGASHLVSLTRYWDETLTTLNAVKNP